MIRTVRTAFASLAMLLAAGTAHAAPVTYILQTPGVV